MAQQVTTTGQQQYGSQPQGVQGGQVGAAGGQLPQQYRQALHSVAQAVQVCGWCADQCIKQADPAMIECIRLCEDVVEIGETLLAVAPRSSRFTADLTRTFTRAAQACGQECGRHADAHCQECAQVLDQTAQSVQQLTAVGQGAAGATGQMSTGTGAQ